MPLREAAQLKTIKNVTLEINSPHEMQVCLMAAKVLVIMYMKLWIIEDFYDHF